MMANHLFGSCMPTFGSCVDRYCMSGYGGGGETLEECLDLATQCKGLDGLELIGNWHVNDDNLKDVIKMMNDRNLQISCMVPDLWTQAKWGRGSLAAPDAKTRRAAVDEVKKVMDWAADLECKYAIAWFGQDGYDYYFQTDYIDAHKWLIEGLAECADHNDKVTILVEYKPREPRRYCFVDSAAKVLLLLKDLDKVKVLLDVGHSLQGRENVAEALALLAHYDKLEYVHLNDNYGDWDDDMMIASVHIPQYLEFMYWLKRVDYKGWLTLDIFPFREDGLRAANECREWIEGLDRTIDRIGMDKIAKVIEGADATQVSAMIREALSL